MPAFKSHIIMAKDISQKLNNIDNTYLETYSLGGDLTKYSKCRKDSHKIYLDEFIYNMADYIKEHNLIGNKEIISVLYAHICHYMMDTTIHPLIRKITRLCPYSKRDHARLEAYLDEYLLSQKKYKITLTAKMTKEIKDMLNYVYDKTYHVKNISNYYKFNLFLYRIYNNLKLYKLINTKKIINNDIDILNTNKTITYNGYDNNKTNDDFISLYKLSIDRTLKYIKEIDKYLKN
jgi:hypothetical protein